VHREVRLGTGVEIEHGGGAVGDLHLPGVESEMAHGGRLLVADQGRQRRAYAELVRQRSQHPARVDDGRQRRLRDAQGLEGGVVPAAAQQIVEPAAGGVGSIGRVYASVRQAGGQPGVERAAPDASGTHLGPVGVGAVEQPLELAGGHQGADQQALRHELLAARLRPDVLPRERGSDGAPRARLPRDRGRALGGEPEGAHATVARGRRVDHGADDAEESGQELLQIVFHETRRRAPWQRLPVGLRGHGAGLVDEQRPHAGRADVQGEDERSGPAGHVRPLHRAGRSLP
jgi:hypothetical protein